MSEIKGVLTPRESIKVKIIASGPKGIQGPAGPTGTSIELTATLSTSWVGEAAPFTQRVDVEDLTESPKPIIGLVASVDTATAIQEEDAFNLISYIDVFDGYLIATCNREKPAVALNLQIKVV